MLYITCEGLAIAEICVLIQLFLLGCYAVKKIGVLNNLRYVDDYAYHAYSAIIMITVGQFVSTVMRISQGLTIYLWWDRLVTTSMSTLIFSIMIYCLTHCHGACMWNLRMREDKADHGGKKDA